MKTLAKMMVMILLLGAGTWLTANTAEAHRPYRANLFQVFYTDLSPYGTWINTPQYGFAWVPDAAPGFQPYSTEGYWTFSNYGWTWVSYYSWGWAPFHYGRWYFDNWYGWVWVPGYDWGPGWVTWRECDGYYGWAPLTPGYNVNVNVDIHIDIPFNYWVFVPWRHFGYHDMDRYYVNHYDNERLYRRSGYMTGTMVDRDSRTRYYTGPAVKDVVRETGRDVKPVAISKAPRPDERYKALATPADRTASGKYTRPPAGSNTKSPVANTGKTYTRPVDSRPAADDRGNGGSVKYDRQPKPVQNAGSTPARGGNNSGKQGYQAKPEDRSNVAPKPGITEPSVTKKPAESRNPGMNKGQSGGKMQAAPRSEVAPKAAPVNKNQYVTKSQPAKKVTETRNADNGKPHR